MRPKSMDRHAAHAENLIAARPEPLDWEMGGNHHADRQTMHRPHLRRRRPRASVEEPRAAPYLFDFQVDA
jgi:hypothetical protein